MTGRGSICGSPFAQQSETRATALLAHAVQNQANVLSYIDGFMLLGFSTLGALLLMLMLKDPPAQPLVLGSASVARPITS